MPLDYMLSEVMKDLKLSMAGWLIMMLHDFGEEHALNQIEFCDLMNKYNFTLEDIMNAIPKEWEDDD